jgi:Kef-type K+ transport system membrane component KefB
VGGITEFMAPYFFFAIAARLDVRLFSGNVLLDAIVIGLLAVVMKGCAVAMRGVADGWA